MPGLLLIASCLFVLAIGFLVIDMFVPTGGILLVMSGLAAIASVLVAFRSSADAGLTFILMVLGSVPVMLLFFLKVWPHTSVGKKMLGILPENQTFQWSTGNEVQDATSLIGCVGRAVTEMIPSGLVEIDGRRFESLSEGKPIEVGSSVRVLRLDVGRLVVTECEEGIGAHSGAGNLPSKSNAAVENGVYSEQNALEQPADQFGLGLDDE